ncbi:MAG: hypothetical protein KC917_07975 [Candidatus Omnitrophica bacterium]|nr:hypothetical protein [Candidatus Omnitrophota bacterium]
MPFTTYNRRAFLQTTALAAGATLLPRRSFGIPSDHGTESFVPVRAITEGPKAHWFGYYDKLQFDPTNRFVLGNEVGFEDRPPKPEDNIKLGMVDLEDGDKWIEVSETTAWCWQQGCMLQWLPGSESKIIHNIRLGDHYGSLIKDVKTGESKTIESPIYTVAPDGKTAMCVNFARLGVLRPGYGYEGIPDPHGDDLITDEDGIYRVDLESGKSELVISLAKMLEVEPKDSMATALNWFNHLLFSPDGERFIFLHRWRPDLKTGWKTRMLTAKPDGSEIHVVADHDMVSHFIWKNPKQILAWSREPEIGDRFFLYTDQSDEKEIIGEGFFKVHGHCTYSPDGEWVCSDTYPGKDNLHHLYLYRPRDSAHFELGRFFQPGEVRGKPNRCDLHPGWSRDGKRLCIDSMMSGTRQLYLVDVSELTG